MRDDDFITRRGEFAGNRFAHGGGTARSCGKRGHTV